MAPAAFNKATVVYRTTTRFFVEKLARRRQVHSHVTEPINLALVAAQAATRANIVPRAAMPRKIRRHDASNIGMHESPSYASNNLLNALSIQQVVWQVAKVSQSLVQSCKSTILPVAMFRNALLDHISFLRHPLIRQQNLLNAPSIQQVFIGTHCLARKRKYSPRGFATLRNEPFAKTTQSR